MSYELPVMDQRVIDDAPREISILANCIGYALAERGAEVTADDAIAAAQRAVDQGWARRSPKVRVLVDTVVRLDAVQLDGFRRFAAAFRAFTKAFTAAYKDSRSQQPAELLNLTDANHPPLRRWRINPETMHVVPEDGEPIGTLTTQDLAWQQWPPCPGCGTTIIQDVTDISTSRDPEPVYTLGAWRCPNDCDHRTMRQRATGRTDR